LQIIALQLQQRQRVEVLDTWPIHLDGLLNVL
jgi:hypothetical protein